mmetsp:Transcript_34970/g.109759  ORF Transcript_34970/g.109759 Transcript_34970/m.109759 type:complete len:202 (+) Transcript_34970:1748-2353(+)
MTSKRGATPCRAVAKDHARLARFCGVSWRWSHCARAAPSKLPQSCSHAGDEASSRALARPWAVLTRERASRSGSIASVRSRTGDSNAPRARNHDCSARDERTSLPSRFQNAEICMALKSSPCSSHNRISCTVRFERTSSIVSCFGSSAATATAVARTAPPLHACGRWAIHAERWAVHANDGRGASSRLASSGKQTRMSSAA